MRLKRVFRVGLLSALAIGLFCGWNFVSAASAESAVITVNTKGLFSWAGLATISGTVNCPGNGTLTLSGTLKQPVGRRFSITGSFNKTINCSSAGAGTWSAQIVPDSGRFFLGPAVLVGSYSGYYTVSVPGYTPYPPAPNCYYYYWDYNTNSYIFQCYVNGSIGPEELKLRLRD
jgi:hypothetical protein